MAQYTLQKKANRPKEGNPIAFKKQGRIWKELGAGGRGPQKSL